MNEQALITSIVTVLLFQNSDFDIVLIYIVEHFMHVEIGDVIVNGKLHTDILWIKPAADGMDGE